MGNCLPETRWKVCHPIRRKRYSHKETQTDSDPTSTIKECFDPQKSMNSKELWYSTVNHNVKHEASVINSNNQTEYACVNISKKKENITNTEEQSDYDYVLIT
ncbi:uncharacterized protein PRD47_003750 [Ara ararauna]